MNYLEELKSLADEKYRLFHSRLVPNIDQIIGVRMPDLKALAKKIAKENPEDFFRQNTMKTYEEQTLQGLVIGFLPCSIEKKLELLRGFIPQITNWATCDCCCANLKDTKKYPQEMLSLIQECLCSEQEYTLRFAVVMLLDFYINNTYIDEVLTVLPAVKSDYYYVKMAVAWALSVCYVKYPEKAKAVITADKLDDFTYKKTLQKIRESKRT